MFLRVNFNNGVIMYMVHFTNYKNVFYVRAINEGDAWLKAVTVSGLKDAQGYVELLALRKV